ncbi:MAG: hypothetical protein BV456_06150 [Thermoplasmata archaeon M8B2D]|nr:MAG: hypothetical protein BV456_06150 [Thermoplasmata archaeon M8B2D]
MPRSRRLRNLIREYKESPRFEKMSFIPPFIILIVEGILLIHAITINVPDIMVVELTLILLAISIVEMILVFGEIHRHYKQNNFDKILTIRLDDFITEKKEINVKKIVTDFIELHPEYNRYRNEAYYTTCAILETHKQKALEKEIIKKLETYIKRIKKADVDEIVAGFVDKYPNYRGSRNVIYEKTCKLKASNKNNNSN